DLEPEWRRGGMGALGHKHVAVLAPACARGGEIRVVRTRSGARRCATVRGSRSTWRAVRVGADDAGWRAAGLGDESAPWAWRLGATGGERGAGVCARRGAELGAVRLTIPLPEGRAADVSVPA